MDLGLEQYNNAKTREREGGWGEDRSKRVSIVQSNKITGTKNVPLPVAVAFKKPGMGKCLWGEKATPNTPHSPQLITLRTAWALPTSPSFNASSLSNHSLHLATRHSPLTLSFLYFLLFLIQFTLIWIDNSIISCRRTQRRLLKMGREKGRVKNRTNGREGGQFYPQDLNLFY